MPCLLNREKNILCFRNVARVDLPVVEDNHSPSVTEHWEKYKVTDHVLGEQLQGIPLTTTSVSHPSYINSVSF